MKLKKGDKVVVTAGKDKGREGKIEKTYPKEKKVLLAGINVYKKHLKRRDEKNPGGIIEISKPLPVSNVSLLCPKCSQPTRIGYKVTKRSKKRICRKCLKLI